MGLIYPKPFLKNAEDEAASAVRCAKQKAARDFNSEEHERLLKNTYDSEIERLCRSHGVTSQTSVAPQLKTGTPELVSHKAPTKLLAMSAEANSKGFTVRKSPVAETPKLSAKEQRIINAWHSNGAPSKDF